MASTKTGNVWGEILSRVETKVNPHSFYTWFKPTAFVHEAGQDLTVKVPNGLFRDWLTKHYAGVIREALGELDREGIRHRVRDKCRGGKNYGGASAAHATIRSEGPGRTTTSWLEFPIYLRQLRRRIIQSICKGRSASRG